MNILCVIPSRMASTRLPRKALLPIKGKPMVQWTYEAALKCPEINKVIVATDHDEIAKVIQSIDGNVVMTDPTIKNGSLRVAKVAEMYEEADVVINLQGDEPFILPSMLSALVSPFLAGEKPEMTTLAFPFDASRYYEPGAVKVITDLKGNAIYFSRSPIPFYRTEVKAPVYNHMGVYAFRRDFLMLYQSLPETPLELTESLEQLRVIEHGYKIRVCVVQGKTLEVNTKEEYELAQAFSG